MNELHPLEAAGFKTISIDPPNDSKTVAMVRVSLAARHNIKPQDIQNVQLVFAQSGHLIATVTIAEKYWLFSVKPDGTETLIESASHGNKGTKDSGAVNIEGLDTAELLAALYNEAKPLGMGALHYNPTPMTVAEARDMLIAMDPRNLCFDYVHGRPLKVNLEKSMMATYLYDRDQGEGKAASIVAGLRLKTETVKALNEQ